MRLFCGNCSTYLGPACQKCPQCGWEVQNHPLRFKPGEQAWPVPLRLEGHPIGRPVIVSGWILAAWRKGIRAGGLSALDSSGQLIWQFTFSNLPVSEPLVSGDMLFLTVSGVVDGGCIYCLRVSPGGQKPELLWKQDHPRVFQSKISGGAQLFENRLYFPCQDGTIVCLDAMSGAVVPGWPQKVGAGLRWLLVTEPYLLAVCRDSGQVFQLDLIRGCSDSTLVSLNSGIACCPLIWKNKLVILTDAGRIVDMDLRKRLIHDFSGGKIRISAMPLVYQNRLVAGSMDHSLYAWQEDGQLFWQSDWHSQHAIACSAQGEEGVLVVAANDGCVYGVDPDTGKIIWVFNSGLDQVLTSGIRSNAGFFYVGMSRKAEEQGYLYALPAYLGEYEYFAQKAQRLNQANQAGELYAAASHYAKLPGKRDPLADLAVAQWRLAGLSDLGAKFWESQVRLDRAACCWQEAAENLRGRDNLQSAEYFYRAARLYWRLGLHTEEAQCAAEAADLAKWPRLRVVPLNNPLQVVGKPGALTVRVENIGYSLAEKLHFDVGGSLLEPISFNLVAPLAPEQHCDLSFIITPTREDDVVKIGLTYAVDGRAQPFTTSENFRVNARKITQVKVGDVVMGEVKVTGQAGDELEIQVGDLVRSKLEIVMTTKSDAASQAASADPFDRG